MTGLIGLKVLRKERKMKQEDIANMLGVKNIKTVSRWETGKANPKRETIERLMDFFKCDYRDLFRNPSSEMDGRGCPHPAKKTRSSKRFSGDM